MNVRVDLNTPIKDGTEVVFRSPVDCSQVTGLKVYYLGGAQEFVFADAHGNNVGDIDHLFAENVAVKVILDVTHGMAFVQNADTNAYLEGRFDDIIEKLCPSFEKKGTLVQCEPVEGYPLDVISATIGNIDVTVCGKNLFNKEAFKLTAGRYVRADGKLTNYAGDSNYACTDGFIPVSHLQGNNITLNHPPVETNGSNPKMIFYTAANENVYISGSYSNGYTITVPENATHMRFSVPKKYADGTQIQIEVGNTVTAYEQYWERKESGGGAAVVKAGKGVNTVFGYAGEIPVEITVKGKADPVALIDKLMQAVFPATVSNEEE